MDVEEYETDQNQANRPRVTAKVEIQHGKWHLEQYNTNQGETNGVETEAYQTNLV